MAYEERFLSENYCTSACYDYHASLFCAIPGRSKYHIDDGNTTATELPNGVGNQHGICADGNVCDVTGNTGMETASGHELYNIKIGSATTRDARVTSDIGTAPSPLTDGYYKASWENYDGSNKSGNHYHHYGIAYITSVVQVPGHPNHS